MSDRTATAGSPDPLFELGEALRAQREQDETIDFAALAERYGVDDDAIRDCLEAMQALEQALGEDLPPLAEAEPLPPPDLPDDYELLQELGQGGMGVVYRARQRSLDRVVAVKVLRPGDRHFGDMLRRFEREAQTLARLNHPHVVPIHEVGRSGDHVYFSMALIQGTSLAELLSRDMLNPTRVVTLLEQVADAVAYVHAQGVIHRDLKPANILLDEAGRAYVADFGLAVDTTSEGLTATGHVLGTPAYMSPEQARADRERIGEASDVYALGAILYECLTGQPPFRRGSLGETLHAVIHDEPLSPRSANPRVPPSLAAVALQALAKDPAERYPSAAALREELARFGRGEPVLAQLPTWRSRAWSWARRNPSLAVLAAQAVIALLALGTLGVVGLLRWRDRVDAERAQAALDHQSAMRSAAHQAETLTARAEAGDGLALAELGWRRAIGLGLAKDVPRALDELTRAAALGVVEAVPPYLHLLQRDFAVADQRLRLEVDGRSIAVRDPALWDRERTRIQTNAAQGVGWALWVRGTLACPPLDPNDDFEVGGDLLPTDAAQAASDLAQAMSSPEYDARWRDPESELLSGSTVGGPMLPVGSVGVRNPAERLRALLLPEPDGSAQVVAALEQAAEAGRVGAAIQLFWLYAGSWASPYDPGSERAEGPWDPARCGWAVVRALELGADVASSDTPFHTRDRTTIQQAVMSAAERGIWRCMLRVADWQQWGEFGLTADPATALEWREAAVPRIQAAAEAGDRLAMHELARLYREGACGLARDEVEAARWERRAEADD